MKRKLVGLTYSFEKAEKASQLVKFNKSLEMFEIEVYGMIHITLDNICDISTLFHTLSQQGVTDVIVNVDCLSEKMKLYIKHNAEKEKIGFITLNSSRLFNVDIFQIQLTAEDKRILAILIPK